MISCSETIACYPQYSFFSDLKEQMKPGWGISIDLMAAIGKEEFYEKFGFVSRPRSNRGAGMDMWLTKEDL